MCAPNTEPPSIDSPVIEVDPVDVPQVVEPPSVESPEIIIPELDIEDPVAPPPPSLPSDIEDPVLPDIPDVEVPDSPVIVVDTLTKKFKLTFQYACRKNIVFQSCTGNVIWNNVIIKSIVPNDYNVHSVTIEVEVKGGENKLQFEGTGFSNSFGLTIDKVRLVRVGTSTNIVVNGDFEAPHVGDGWGIFNNIPGWEGIGIEIGRGTIYNQGWAPNYNQVTELDGHNNTLITQRWSFDSQYKLVHQIPCDTNNFIGKFLKFKLSFQYAARKNGVSGLLTSSAVITWNNVVIGTIHPTDYLVHTFTKWVDLKAGNNVLHFDGTGASDYKGLNIDNVKLVSKYFNNYQNLIQNGEFENPYVSGVHPYWKYINNGGIPHWSAYKGEIGHCHKVYNHNWPVCNGQCIELDSTHNQRYTHVVHISQFLFNKILINTATYLGDAAVSDEISSAADHIDHKVNWAVQEVGYGIYYDIKFLAYEFDQYLCQLYHVQGAHVKDLKYNSQLTIYKYDCLSQAYVSAYGHSYEHDFTSAVFNLTNLNSWSGYIKAIHGKVLQCVDPHGHLHYLQIAPCTHYEGQFSLPKLGAKIYWEGVQQSNGKTYVKYATTCNC